MDVTNGTSACNPVDDVGTVTVGDTYEVAICLTSAGAEPNTIGFDLVYDDALNLCVPLAVSCSDEGSSDSKCVDDNPDANAGVTKFSTPTSLGTGWDCTGVGVAPPHCDNDAPPARTPPLPGRTAVCRQGLPWLLLD